MAAETGMPILNDHKDNHHTTALVLQASVVEPELYL